MNFNLLTNFALLVFFLAFICLILIQLKKLLKTKSRLETFLLDLNLLNKNIQSIIDVSKVSFSSHKDIEKKEQNICQNCKSRLVYIDFSSNKLFYYKCKLSGEYIKLDYSCNSFQKDLQDSKI